MDAIKRVTLAQLAAKKSAGQKISMLTAYDAPLARLFDEAGIDSILVGDSAGNVVLGYDDTRPVTMEEMLVLARAVRRGAKRAFLIGDMPYLSYQIDQAEALRNAGRFIKEAGMDAVKIEGGTAVLPLVAAMRQAGIPVVGHLGLTPQSAELLGGYRVQGKSAQAAFAIYQDALALEAAGAVMLVLECVPARLAQHVANALTIPVIGIGAGALVDGQVLVAHDMLGIRSGHSPRFVKAFAALDATIREAAAAYRAEVEQSLFPAEAHSFALTPEEGAQLDAMISNAGER